jgi:hypothetical protein
MEAAPSSLAAWETFFFLVGSSGAALTGLQFVVIALISESRRAATTREIQIFGTPNIVHFGAVLLISAIISAPWHGLSRLSYAVAICGAGGILYTLVTFLRARRLKTYRPVLEDWIWHVGLPMITYGAIIAAALFISAHAHQSLFVIGFSALLILFIGIHNAWDAVTYITIDQAGKRKS